jgi:beta-N-acetylhexosaminidase
VIVGTIRAEHDASQSQLVQAHCQRGQSPVVIALRTPYDVIGFPMVETYLCAYGIRPVTMEAVARVLFGEIEARGVLPCAIPDALAG